MAEHEKPPASDAEQAEKATRPGNIDYDPEAARAFRDRLLNLHTKLDSESGRIKSDINEVYDEAKRAGIPKNLMKAVIKKIRGRAKEKAAEAELEEAYPGGLDKLEQALGMYADTPLGQAAIARATPVPQPQDSLNPTGPSVQAAAE